MKLAIAQLVAPLILGCTLMVTPGCRYMLPAHGNSNVQKGETPTIEFITRDDLDPKQVTDPVEVAKRQELLDNYLKAFPEMKVDPKAAPHAFVAAALLAPVAAAAVGYTFDQISKAIKEEAELYEQQWTPDTEWNTGFWKLDNNAQPSAVVTSVDSAESSSVTTTTISKIQTPSPETNITMVINNSEVRRTNTATSYLQMYKQYIYGVKIVRYYGDGGTNLASEIVIGFAPIEGQGMFMVKPVSYRCLKAKAKVLGLTSSFIPLAMPWILGKYPGNQVKTSVELKLESKWMEKQEIQNKQLASFTIQLPNYNISKNDTLTVGDGLPRSVVGIFGGVPVSLNSKGLPLTEQDQKLDRCGVLGVTAVVTEKDISNAKNRLLELQKTVDEQKTNVTDKVSAYFKG